MNCPFKYEIPVRRQITGTCFVCPPALLQTLAIYDRFGRLMLGDEQQPKDVLEYLVIERHLVNPYSRWRLHGKIVPSWAPAKDPIIKVRTLCVRRTVVRVPGL